MSQPSVWHLACAVLLAQSLCVEARVTLLVLMTTVVVLSLSPPPRAATDKALEATKEVVEATKEASEPSEEAVSAEGSEDATASPANAVSARVGARVANWRKGDGMREQGRTPSGRSTMDSDSRARLLRAMALELDEANQYARGRRS